MRKIKVRLEFELLLEGTVATLPMFDALDFIEGGIATFMPPLRARITKILPGARTSIRPSPSREIRTKKRAS